MSEYRILIVEDDPVSVTWMKRTLEKDEKLNPEIVHCETFADAKDEIARTEFSLVILDLHLPDASGLETVHKMAVSTFGTTPVIVLTGTEDDQMATKAITAGFKAYLVKGKSGPDDVCKAAHKALGL